MLAAESGLLVGDVLASFDDLIGACDQRQRNGDTKRLGGFEIDRHFERRWLNDGKLGRFLPFENPSDVNARLVPCVDPAGAIADQASRRQVASSAH